MQKKIVLKDEAYWGDEVYSLLSWFNADKVRNAKVMVVGAGALGNEVLKNLALFGIGNILIVDFDKIELSNLSRSVLFREVDAKEKRFKAEVAVERIREINPQINLMAVNGDITSEVGLGLIREMDVIIACLDSRLSRYVINQHAFRANKPWIDGGIENMEGYVRVFMHGHNCYECSLTDEELTYISLRTGCPDVAKANVSQGRIATTPLSASVIGAIQVQEALKIIHKDDLDKDSYMSLLGKLYKYNGMFAKSHLFTMKSYNKNCVSHDIWEPVIKIPGLSNQHTVNDALGMIKKVTGSNEVYINLKNNVFVEKIIPESTEEEIKVLLPESRIADYLKENLPAYNPRERIYQDYVEDIGDDFEYKMLTLEDIGIPPYDVIQVSTSRGLCYVELSGDRNLQDVLNKSD